MKETPPWWDDKKYGPWIILERLADIILYFVPGCIVEIGLGASTVVLAKVAREYNVKHYAIDTSKSRCESIESKSKTNHKNLIVYRGRSLDFIEEFDDSPSLVFIDGCHKSEVVLKEAMFFLEKLNPGGIMFFHDMYLCEEWKGRHEEKGKYSDTYLARWILENMKNVWCFTFPYTAAACGLTMVMKKPEYEYTADPLDLAGLGKRCGDWTYKGQVL